MNTSGHISIILLRVALAAGLLSAVASRLGLWGSHSSGWNNFLTYTAEVNSFAPKAVIPAIAVASTLLETSLGLMLLFGFKVKQAATAAAILTLLFAVAMTYSFGIKEPLDYSVFAFSAAAWMLANILDSNATSTNSQNTNQHNMNTKEMNQLTRSNQLEWQPLAEEGINTKGIFVKILRYDATEKRPPAFLLKFEPGAAYPNHNHPGGEEVFVLEGQVRFGPDHLAAGDYLYTAPGATHAVFSKTGCVLMFLVPQEVEILK